MTNPNLDALATAGTSAWLDDLSRQRLDGGELKSLVDEYAVVGVTTNPAIFASAMSKGTAYDAQIAELRATGADATEAVFTKTMCDHLFTLAFDGMSTDSEETVTFARYIEQNEILTVRIDLAEEALPLGRVYDFDSMDILSEDKNRIVAVFATEMDGETSVNVKITLTKTENGWRLDSPTY